MPFDSTQQDTLTMADLAWRLRNPETWPPGFTWDYMDCNKCAMGLAWQLSGGKKSPFKGLLIDNAVSLTMALMADAQAMDHEPFREIFLLLHGRHEERVTPENVADAIDDYLSTR